MRDFRLLCFDDRRCKGKAGVFSFRECSTVGMAESREREGDTKKKRVIRIWTMERDGVGVSLFPFLSFSFFFFFDCISGLRRLSYATADADAKCCFFPPPL